jgi:type I restriction enzyme M protein
MLDDIPMADRDTNGDLYEYLLSKIASAGVNGQFRTPRHIIELMVKMTAPQPSDEICDPACGTAGFLVAASEYVRDTHAELCSTPLQRKHFHQSMFHGYDFDSTMLRIGSMNMLLHGIESPDIRYRDSLSEGRQRRRRQVHPDPRQPAVRRLARLRGHRQGPATDRQDEEDRAALPRAVPQAP